MTCQRFEYPCARWAFLAAQAHMLAGGRCRLGRDPGKPWHMETLA